MFYRVIKGAVDRAFIADIERTAAALPAKKAATVEGDEHATREAELRWIKRGRPGFDKAERLMLDALDAEGVLDARLCVMEDIQHTVYGPGGFHDWHIDSYRRSYNLYDMGPAFVGKSRTMSLSILLNDAAEFTGGSFEISMFPNGRNTVGSALTELSEAGDLAIFDSRLCHRVAPVESGIRRSLVGWICS